MGALVSTALRPIKSFNIENRAHRVISKEKPTPAPTYPQNLVDLQRTIEENPNLDDKLDRKDSGLDNRLKDVYVTSLGRPEDDVTKEMRAKRDSERPLPQDRRIVQYFEMGFKEPERIPYGRTTLRNAIDFISAHQVDPDQVTAAKIAFEYKLKEEDVANVLKYYKTYEIYLPKTKKSPAVFAGPTQMKKQLYETKFKEIDDKNKQINDKIETDIKRIKEQMP